jgi:phosphopantetheinyl transferase (holo-ACP synthase)
VMRTSRSLNPLMVGKRLLISLSHTRDSAMALALLMDDGGEEA